MVRVHEDLIRTFGDDVTTESDVLFTLHDFQTRTLSGCAPEVPISHRMASERIFGPDHLVDAGEDQALYTAALEAAALHRHNLSALTYLMRYFYMRASALNALRVALVHLETGGEQCEVRTLAAACAGLLGWNAETALILQPCVSCAEQGHGESALYLSNLQLREAALHVVRADWTDPFD